MIELHYEILGGAKYQRAALANVPRDRGVKLFANTFGNAKPLARKFAERGHPIIAMQGTWAGDSHNYTGAHRKTAIREAVAFDNIASLFPTQDFYYSPYCEHNHGAAHMNELLEEIESKCEHLILFNSPNKNGVILPRWLNEVHGDYNPRDLRGVEYMWACDGMSIYDCDFARWMREHERAILKWAWIAQFNCKHKTTEKLPINQRKVRPVKKQFLSIGYMEAGKSPDTNLPAKFTWKSHSDQSNDRPRGREQKPVLICPVASEYADLINEKGRRVHRLFRNGNYHDGRPLYRASKWGYEIGQRYGRSLRLRINGKIYGTIDPGFRQNEYRTN